jgi:hypothetical protein
MRLGELRIGEKMVFRICSCQNISRFVVSHDTQRDSLPTAIHTCLCVCVHCVAGRTPLALPSFTAEFFWAPCLHT